MRYHSHFSNDEMINKTYDLKLLKKLLKYVAPHKRIVFLSIACMLISTSVQLLVPYITKEGIDRYLATLYHVYEKNPKGTPGSRPLTRNDFHNPGDKDFIEIDTEHWLIKKTALKLLDIPVRKSLLKGNNFSKTTYYLFPASEKTAGIGRSLGDYWLVPERSLSKVPPGILIKVRGSDIHGITMLALLLGCLIIFSMAAGYIHLLAIQVAGQRSMRDLRIQLFSHIQGLDLSLLDRNPVGRLVTRVANDIEALNEFFAAVVVNLLKDMLLIIGTMVILLWLNLKLGLIIIGLTPLVFIVLAFFRVKLRNIYREVRRLLAKLNSDLAEDLNGIKVVQAFNRQKARREHFKSTNYRYFSENFRQTKTFGIFRPMIDIVTSLAIALILLYGGIGVLSGALSLGALVAFVSYVRQMFKPIADMSEKYNIMQRAMASLDRIFKIFDQKPTIIDPHNPVKLQKVSGMIDFEDVFFSYNPEKQVLKGISFSVKAGKSVAIVGPTGAGKTSIINLICRFYDPDSGIIKIDGIDIKKLSLQTLSNNISMVLQDSFIFSRTVEDNIRLGKQMKREQVVQAAKIVQAHDFICNFAEGFDSMMSERGATLSTGQKQLLCFARALTHDPKILILDEATSSIDPETETKIQHAIKTLMKNRTSIIVAHRLSTIKNADEILVIDDGLILERGTHKELISKRGIYYNLYLLQYKNGNV